MQQQCEESFFQKTKNENLLMNFAEKRSDLDTSVERWCTKYVGHK